MTFTCSPRRDLHACRLDRGASPMARGSRSAGEPGRANPGSRPTRINSGLALNVGWPTWPDALVADSVARDFLKRCPDTELWKNVGRELPSQSANMDLLGYGREREREVRIELGLVRPLSLEFDQSPFLCAFLITRRGTHRLRTPTRFDENRWTCYAVITSSYSAWKRSLTISQYNGSFSLTISSTTRT